MDSEQGLTIQEITDKPGMVGITWNIDAADELGWAEEVKKGRCLIPIWTLPLIQEKIKIK